MKSQRSAFALPDDVHYLNCAYMAPQSKRVTDVGLANLGRKERPYDIHESHFFDEANRVRDLFARLISADQPDQIAVVPSSSYAFAQAVRNTPLSRGQNVVSIGEEFPSLVYTFRRACALAGAELRLVDRPVGGVEHWSERVAERIDSNTAAVAMSSVHWTDGTRFDLGMIGARAREVGAAFVVDGTQSIGAAPFSVAELEPDVVVCPAYKWLTGPYAVGVAYFGARYLEGTPIEESWMTRHGSDDFASLADYTDRYRAGAVRYDVGEACNFILIPMLAAALEQLIAWDPGEIQRYAHGLTRELMAALIERGYDVGESTEKRYGHLLGIRLPAGTDPRALRAKLAERKIYVSVRSNAVRVSVNVYNDAGDIDALLAALTEG